MLTPARNSRTTRRAATAALALGLALGSVATVAGAADAAPAGAIYVPNGMVGVSENIAVQVPGVAGQTITLGLSSGPIATTVQAVVNAQGWASATWTPTAAGAWTISGLGTAAPAGSTTITVAPMPTYTVLMAQQSVQQGVNNNLAGAVVAPISSLAPTGSVSLATAGGAGITTQPLSGSFGAGTSTVALPWNPSAGGSVALQAAFQPNNGNYVASTSPISQPFATTARTTVALRWPATLYAGTTTVISAVLGAGLPDGSVAFSMDGTGISGSIPTVNGVANYQWTPPTAGIHTIAVSYTGNPVPNQLSQQSGTNSQIVNIQGARAMDNITVDPPTQPAWSIARPIVMAQGTKVTLAATTTSNTTVLFSEQGPCVINGSVLTALSPGQCQVTAFTAGNASLTPGSETYTITVTAPAKR